MTNSPDLGKPRETTAYAILYAIIAFALIKPDSLPYLGFGWLESMLIGLDLAVMVFLTASFAAGIQISRVTIAVSILFAVTTLTTWLGTQDFSLIAKIAGPAVAACMLTDYGMARNPTSFLNGMTWGLFLAYFLNFVTILLYYPAGLYTTSRVSAGNYFMGFDNGMIYGLAPLAVFALTRSLVIHGRLLTPLSISSCALMVFSVAYVRSISGLITAVAFLLLLSTAQTGWLTKSARRMLLVGWFGLAILIIATRHMKIIPVELTSALGKDQTLTGRVSLWDSSLEILAEHPLFGLGVGVPVPGPLGRFYPHPHSLVLDSAYTGGLVGAIALVGVIVAVIRSSDRAPSSWVTWVVYSGILCLLLHEIANSTQFKAMFWATLALLPHCKILTRMMTSTRRNIDRTSRSSDRSERAPKKR